MRPRDLVRAEDEVYEEPIDTVSGSITSITDNDEDLGALLLKLIGGAMVALQMLNEVPADGHDAVASRIGTLKSIISNLPDNPVNPAGPKGRAKTRIGFQPPLPVPRRGKKKACDSAEAKPQA